MKRHILIYGLVGGLLIVLLRAVEYRFLVIEHSVEIYGGLVAMLFAGLGIWLGLKLTRNKEKIVIKEVPIAAPERFTLNQPRLQELGITPRELEILELIARGLSNREIAEQLFIAEGTVKNHVTNILGKLDVRDRTQAALKARELGFG